MAAATWLCALSVFVLVAGRSATATRAPSLPESQRCAAQLCYICVCRIRAFAHVRARAHRCISCHLPPHLTGEGNIINIDLGDEMDFDEHYSASDTVARELRRLSRSSGRPTDVDRPTEQLSPSPTSRPSATPTTAAPTSRPSVRPTSLPSLTPTTAAPVSMRPTSTRSPHWNSALSASSLPPPALEPRSYTRACSCPCVRERRSSEMSQS